MAVLDLDWEMRLLKTTFRLNFDHKYICLVPCDVILFWLCLDSSSHLYV